VPEDLFVHVQELGAVVVDPRDVVRKLRDSGLRTSKGKSAKRWHHAAAGLADVPLTTASELAEAMASAVSAEARAVEVLARPGEVALVASGPDEPADLPVLREMAGSDCAFLVASAGPWGWAVEAVWPAPL